HLYEGTGFPQPVQGKRGENQGESRSACNIFVLCFLWISDWKNSRTRRLVWASKCVLCTIAFGPPQVSNGTGTRVGWTFGQVGASNQWKESREAKQKAAVRVNG